MFGLNNNKFEGNNVEVIGQMADDFVLSDDMMFDSSIDTFSSSKITLSGGAWQLLNGGKVLQIDTATVKLTCNEIASKRVGTEPVYAILVMKNVDVSSRTVSVNSNITTSATSLGANKTALFIAQFHTTYNYLQFPVAKTQVLSLVITKKCVVPACVSSNYGGNAWKGFADSGYRLLPIVLGDAFLHQNSKTNKDIKLYLGIRDIRGTIESINRLYFTIRAKKLFVDLRKIHAYFKTGSNNNGYAALYDGTNTYIEELSLTLNRYNTGTHEVNMYNSLKKVTFLPDGLGQTPTDALTLRVGNATRLTIDGIYFNNEYIRDLYMIFHSSVLTFPNIVDFSGVVLGQYRNSYDFGYVDYSTLSFENVDKSSVYLDSYSCDNDLSSLLSKTRLLKVISSRYRAYNLFAGNEELTYSVLYIDGIRTVKLPTKVNIVVPTVTPYTNGGVMYSPNLVGGGTKYGYNISMQVHQSVNVTLTEVTLPDSQCYYVFAIPHVISGLYNVGKIDLPANNLVTLPTNPTSAFALNLCFYYYGQNNVGEVLAPNYTLNQFFAKIPDLSAMQKKDIYDSNVHKNVFYYMDLALADESVTVPDNIGNFQTVQISPSYSYAAYAHDLEITIGSLAKTDFLRLNFSSDILHKIKLNFAQPLSIRFLEITNVRFVDITNFDTKSLTITNDSDFTNTSQYIYYDNSRQVYVMWKIIATYIKKSGTVTYSDWKTTAKRLQLQGYQKLPLGTHFIAPYIEFSFSYSAYAVLTSMESIYENYDRFKSNPNDPNKSTSSFAKTLITGYYGYSQQVYAAKPDGFVLKSSDGLSKDIPYKHSTNFATISANSYTNVTLDKLPEASTRKLSVQIRDLQGDPIEGMLLRITNFMHAVDTRSNFYTTSGTKYHMYEDSFTRTCFNRSSDYSACRFSTDENGICEIKYLAPVKYYYEVFDKYGQEIMCTGVLDCSLGDASTTLYLDILNKKKVRIYLSLTHGGYTNYVKPGTWSSYSNYWFVDGVASTLFPDALSNDTECWVELTLSYGTHEFHLPILDAKTGSDGSVLVKFQEKFTLTVDENTPSSVTVNFDYAGVDIVNTTIGYLNLATLSTGTMSSYYSCSEHGYDFPQSHANTQSKYFVGKTYLCKFAVSGMFVRIAPVVPQLSDEGTTITRVGLWPMLTKTSPYYVTNYGIYIDSTFKYMSSVSSNYNREWVMVIRDFYGDGVDYFYYGSILSTPYSNSVNPNVDIVMPLFVGHIHLANELRYVLANQQNADNTYKYRWTISA